MLELRIDTPIVTLTFGTFVVSIDLSIDVNSCSSGITMAVSMALLASAMMLVSTRVLISFPTYLVCPKLEGTPMMLTLGGMTVFFSSRYADGNSLMYREMNFVALFCFDANAGEL